MANNVSRFAAAFQKARDLLSLDFIRSILRGFSVLGAGYALAKIISLAEELFIGRVLGLEVYGTYLIILAIAAILNAVMMLGLPKAIVKLVAERNERIADVPTNAFLMAFFLAVVTSVPVIIIGSSDSSLALLGITRFELVFGYAVAFFLTLYTVAQSFKLALYEIRFVVIADILYWSVALIFFVIFRDLRLGVIGICVGAVLGSLVLLHRVPVGFARFSIPSIKSLLPLSIYLGADSVLGISAQQISFLYLNIIAAAYAVGVFGAYYRSSIFLIVPLVTVLSMALYPRFCSIDQSLRPRVGRYLAYGGIPICIAAFVLSFISGMVFLRFFGLQLEFPFLLLVLAIYSGLFVYNRIWDKLVTACEGAKMVGWGIAFGTLTFLSVMLVLTPYVGGMLAIATGMVANEIVYAVLLLSWFKLRVADIGNQKL
jgi:O-antigen/teichoic acid export membrane protein